MGLTTELCHQPGASLRRGPNHKETAMLKNIHPQAFGLIAGLVLACCSAGPSFASEDSDVMEVVTAYLNDMNTGDVANFTRLCAPQVAIIDDFPPHVWQGANACMDWLTALVAFDAKAGVTPGELSIGAPRRVSVNGDSAYVVLPAGYKYMRHGKPVDEAHSVWTVSLHKTADGWRVTGWAWSQG
jgi:ketosteroid isomerase-like protein